MESISAANSQHMVLSARPRATLPARISSMLNNAHNSNIYNNTFCTNVKTDDRTSLNVLYERVAPNAILNAGGRADEVRCHPGTREEVIELIEKWRTDAHDDVTPSRMLWLSGPAGAGKSAIVQTVAENWASYGVHAANFFFFRTDASRNHASSLVPTLLYQIFDFYPAARDAVEEVLASKPRILDASIEEQFNQLICAPFFSIGPSFSQSIVLLIDGLDECDLEEKTSQRQILDALDTLVSRDDLPFLVLVASRVEHQITMAFNRVSSEVNSIFLNDEYSPHKDIHRFVSAEFDKIKTTHHLVHTLNEDWPSASAVDEIVTKSSGQFIYAATVMRFILYSSASPKLSLDRVQGAAEIITRSPFSQLDTLYTYVLSQADDQQVLKDVLHAHFLISKFYFRSWVSRNRTPRVLSLLRYYNHRYTDNSVGRSCIASMNAIARFESGHLIFYHSSLPDYLLDQSRSGTYFVDVDAFSIQFLPRLLEHDMSEPKVSRMVFRLLSALKTMTPDIINALLRVPPKLWDDSVTGFERLRHLHGLCIRDDDVAKYKQILHRYVVYYLSQSNVTFESALHALHKIPCIQRYLTMALIEQRNGDVSGDPNVMVDTLRPESASEGQEIALWILELLQRMHREYYPRRLETYKRLLKQWIYWAASNDVSLSTLRNIQNIPYSQMYITMARIERLNGDDTQEPDIVVDALRPESTSDTHEITLWVENLLQHIHGKYYPLRLETYKRLIRQWIFWSAANNVSLSNLCNVSNVPCSQRYFTMARIEHLHGDATQDPDIVVDALRPESASDAQEIIPWVQNLLQRVYDEYYPRRLETYKRLMAQWIFWAVLNDIALADLRNLPYARWYFWQATAAKWFLSYLKPSDYQ